jgi:predicted nucleic acid-binding Zn ribbon protein
MSGRMDRDHGPQPLGPSLERVAGGLGMPASEGVGRVFARWSEIVGPSVATHVRPLRFDRDALVVRVDHPAWATQIRHLSEQVLDRVATVAEVPRPDRLDVRIRG